MDKIHEQLAKDLSNYIQGFRAGIEKAIKIVDNEFMYYLQQEVIILKLRKLN